jgi:hypothetical protein
MDLDWVGAIRAAFFQVGHHGALCNVVSCGRESSEEMDYLELNVFTTAG